MDIGSKVFGKQDKQGNQLLVRGFYDENKQWTNASVHLKLAKMSKPRLLGYVDVQEAVFHVVRDTAKHYHYKTKGFGFNWEILTSNLIDIKTISLKVDENTLYVFPKSLLIDYGTFLNFKQQGFELQRFLRLDLIKRHAKISTRDTGVSYVEIAG